MPPGDSVLVPDREVAVGNGARLPLRIWLRLLTCVNMTEAMVRARLHIQFGTTLPRFDVLAALDAAGEELTMGALSARLMVTSGNVTGLIKAMEQDGLVGRRRHPADRRSTLIGMTDAGRALFSRMAPAHARWIEQAMAGLDRTEATELWDRLGRLKDSVRDAGSESQARQAKRGV
ncbi:MAG TPA: MarR family transcriptional regulator [Acetobacteraceae bacterium]|jgi:DNA-binding MarR family transcriptional regulator|nr:MarR family transcriptional regulator [Acetobacteraceae bacterium]